MGWFGAEGRLAHAAGQTWKGSGDQQSHPFTQNFAKKESACSSLMLPAFKQESGTQLFTQIFKFPLKAMKKYQCEG